MCLRLLQSALAALPVHLSIIVRVSTLGDGSSQRNELGDQARGVARRFRGSNLLRDGDRPIRPLQNVVERRGHVWRAS